MPQEPWKRARQLHELKQAGIKPAPKASQARPVQDRRNLWRALLGWIIVILVLSLGAAAYFFRGLWIPRYREAMPPGLERVVQEVAPEPQVTLDYQALEGGLGIELRIFGDYLDVLKATNTWGVQWQLTDTGAGTSRCTAPGVKLYVEQGRIRSYELDVAQVFEDAAWKPWRSELKRAGISPDLTWTALTGETEMPRGMAEREIHSSNDAQWAGTTAHAMWKLQFTDGWLRYLNGGITVGSVSLEEAAQGAQPAPAAVDPEAPAAPVDPELEREWVE